MYKKFEMELAGRTLRVDVDRVAKQANGAVLMHYVTQLYCVQQQHLTSREKELISSHSA